MSYSGDPSLSADLQERIQKTFAQTLELTARGSREEARLGCDFILRMDPRFELARALLDRLALDGPVEIEDLRSGQISRPAPSAGGFELDAVDEIDDFDDLELDFEVPAATIATPIEPPPPIAPPVAAPPSSESGLAAALEELLAKRDPRRVIQIADENKDEVTADPRLRKLLTNAYSLLESEPYVRDFLDKARLAIQEGNAAAAHQLIEKARSLDPSHPGIKEIEQAQGFYNDPARRMGNRRRGIEVEDDATQLSGQADAGNETLFEPSSMVPTIPDLAPPPAPVPAPAPAAPTSNPAGGDDRIQELLDQGQAAYERDDFQSAIDAWSRIFLIDIDHEEAARRIEEARGRKAENERRVEEVYQEALIAFDAGESERAKGLFKRVLELAPGHLAAGEYLEQLARRAAPAPAPPPPTAPEPAAAPAAHLPSLDSVFDEAPADLPLDEEIFEPPSDIAATRRSAVSPAGVARKGGRGSSAADRSTSNFLYIGGAVLILVAALAYLALDQREKWFPNSQPEEVLAVPDELGTLENARALWQEGKHRAATRLLEIMPEDDVDYPEAEEQLAAWASEPMEAEPETVEAAEGGISLDRLVRHQDLLDRARQAILGREYLLAERYFSRAALIRDLAPEDQQSLVLARQQLEPLSQQIELFEDDDWQFLLPALWSMFEAEPDNRDVVRLIVDSYYNLGVRDLQRGKAELAAEKFREAQRLRAEDAEVQRHLAFAETYTQRPKDLLYRIYIKYLPFR